MSSRTEISAVELHAFIDGELDDARAQVIASEIKTNPALAERVAEFRTDRAMLKRVYGPVADSPIPADWLALARSPKAPSAMSWRLVGSIAAVLVLAIVATIFYRTLKPSNGDEIVQVALDARQGTSGEILKVSGKPGANGYNGGAGRRSIITGQSAGPGEAWVYSRGYPDLPWRAQRPRSGTAVSRQRGAAIYALFAAL